MLTYPEVPVIILLLVSLAYAMFDVFNRRNVPNTFVYATVILGFIVAIAFNYNVLTTMFGIVAVVAVFGWILYKSGLLGGGDVMEFIFISLVFPIQNIPYVTSLPQFNFPFIISVLIASGYAALIYIPIYYIAVKRNCKPSKPNGKDVRSGLLILASYIIFIFFIYLTFGLRIDGIILIVLLAGASALTVIYEKDVYRGMVEFIYPKMLEEGDMIATNMMSNTQKKRFEGIRSFGRLATGKLINDTKNIKIKIPVYRDSVPFALFIFIGVVISLVLGNLILFIIGV